MKRSTNNNSANINQTSPKSFLCNFGYVDYIILASTISIALGEELSSNDLNVLASFLAVLSDELALVSSVQSCSSGNSDDFTFVAPNISRKSNNNDISNKSTFRKRTIIKKRIVKKKIKKCKDT
ncbi:MAG: hypothetical protein RR942_07575 [Romboutsia sp.]